MKGFNNIIRIALIILTVIGVIFLVNHVKQCWWTNLLWQLEVERQAKYAGTLQAYYDNTKGIRRILVAQENGSGEFLNQMDGPFEVWGWPYLKDGGMPAKIGAESYVDAYNNKMRFMASHPEKFSIEDKP